MSYTPITVPFQVLPLRLPPIRREIPGGARIPRGYGVAYHELSRDIAVCYPLPFNWLVGWVRLVYFRLLRGPRDRYLAALELSVRQRNSVNLRAAVRQMERHARDEAARRVREVQFTIGEPLDGGPDDPRDREIAERILQTTVDRVREAFARAVERG